MRSIYILGVILLVSCSQDKVDQHAEAEKLMELSREWSQAAYDRDIDKLLSFWDEDAMMFDPGSPVLRGKDNIQAMVARSLIGSDFEIRWEPQEAYVSESGDLGYVIFKNYMKSGSDSLGTSQIRYGKGIEIWKKDENGEWKNVVDIYNSDPSIDSIY